MLKFALDFPCKSEHQMTSSDNSDRFTLSPIIRVTVHDSLETRQTHNLHLDLLTSKSKYFAACLKGNFSEAASREIELPDVDSQAFGMFAEWLYSGNVTLPAIDITPDEKALLMADLYILGDRLLCSGVKNRAFDIIQEYCKHHTVEAALILKLVGSGESLKESRLVRYLVWQMAHEIAVNGISQYALSWQRKTWMEMLGKLGEAQVSMLMEIVETCTSTVQYVRETGFLDSKSLGSPAYFGSCQWHEHASLVSTECKQREERDWSQKEAESEG